MRTHSRHARPAVLVTLLALVTAASALRAQDPNSVPAAERVAKAKQADAREGSASPAALIWAPAPVAFPPGARMAIVRGDPAKAEPFEARLSMPDGYRIPPHFHPSDESIRVRSGVLLVGMGDTVDLDGARRMAPGDTGTLAANVHHYVATRGRTVVQLRIMGPFALTYVNPADDPRRRPPSP